VVKINFRGDKINFHRGKNQFYFLWHTQISVLATRARVTVSFDWLAFAVNLFWWAAVLGKLRAYLIDWCSSEPRTYCETKGQSVLIPIPGRGCWQRGGHRQVALVRAYIRST